MEFSIIAAVDKDNGLGKAGRLAWRLKGDLEHFKAITTRQTAPGKQNVVVMGSTTWNSLPAGFRPLPGRLNVVLNHHGNFLLPGGVLLATSFDEVFNKLAERRDVGDIFIIGGASVYGEAIKDPACSYIYLTRLDQSFGCDVFFPAVDENIFTEISVSPTKEENNITYRFIEYARIIE